MYWHDKVVWQEGMFLREAPVLTAVFLWPPGAKPPLASQCLLPVNEVVLFQIDRVFNFLARLRIQVTGDEGTHFGAKRFVRGARKTNSFVFHFFFVC